ncbi:MAG: tripartite tricarboxylate transporter substrate binding protein [Alcaligenaceae bacterium]|nr:tripartite tricarboxylate transporter substrate binding protein [Alcaligenaceae bacterium]
MKLRTIPFRLAIVALAMSLGGGAVLAQDYPSRPVRLVIPQSAGSGGDIIGRMMADYMAASLRQPVVVENKAGANGIVAATTVAKEQPDGHTIMLGLVSQLSFNRFLYKDVPYDGFEDFTYLNPVVETPYVLVVSKQSGIADFASFIRKAKENPGGLNYASAGNGNMTHLSMALLAEKQQIKLTHIPYKGSAPALTSVMSGESDAMVSVLGAALSQISAKSVVPIALLGDRRAAQIPDTPTLSELGVDMPKIPGWYALVGPANIPAAIAGKLSASVQGFLADPAMAAKLQELYLEPMAGSGADIRARAIEESKIWGNFIQENGIGTQ